MISERPIIVDDIRVRAIGRSGVQMSKELTKATEPPRIQAVWGFCKFHLTFDALNWSRSWILIINRDDLFE